MLDTERQTQIFEAWQRLEENNGPLDESIKHFLAVEQFKTQEALNNLGGINAYTPISEVPHINEVFTSQILSKEHEQNPKLIEGLGIANSGKTTLLENVVESGDYYYSRESYQEAKRVASVSSNPFPIIQLLEERSAVKTLTIPTQIKKGEIENRPIICDRLFISNVIHRRLWFLWGNMLPFSNQLALDAPKRIEDLVKSREFDYSVLLCLISPNVYYERKGKKPIKYVEMQIEQNLRFHYEALNYQEITGNPRPFSYATIDLTGSLEENQIIFTSTLDRLLKR